MDNITHSLIGISLGHAAAGNQAERRWRSALIWTAVIGSNFPDLDFVVRFFAHDTKLLYLLEHRGHSHTFLFALPAGLLSGLLGAKIAGFRSDADAPGATAATVGGEARRGWIPLLLLGVLSAFLHIGADFWNDYGVHPLWPFSNRWYYGDFIFIVEPMLWSVLLPLAILEARGRFGRYAWGAFAGLALGLVWLGGYMTWPLALAVTAWSAVLTAVMIGLRHTRRRVWATAAGLAIVLLAFVTGSHLARRAVRDQLAVQAPTEQEVQLVSSPAPGNPACWRVILASLAPASGEYIVRVGVASLGFTQNAGDGCYPHLGTERTMPLQATWPSDSHLVWLGEFRGNAAELKSLASSNCGFAALLHFARVPFWIKQSGQVIGGDARYDREPGLGFSEFAFANSAACPTYVPLWIPPLRFLLD